MLFVPYGRPDLSGRGEPETFVGAATLHVGGSRSGLVSR
jgi:hypothetical protein